MDGFELNKASFTEAEIERHKRAKISEGINSSYTHDAQLAIIFNALELIVDSMPDGDHKTELQNLLAFRKNVKQEVNK